MFHQIRLKFVLNNPETLRSFCNMYKAEHCWIFRADADTNIRDAEDPEGFWVVQHKRQPDL